jgi:hypothetical protein
MQGAQVIGQQTFTPATASAWSVAAVADVFTPFRKTPFFGEVFAILRAGDRIQAIGDFNGDGAKDLLLRNPVTGLNSIWFMNFDGGALYQVGPTLRPGLPSGLQVIPN